MLVGVILQHYYNDISFNSARRLTKIIVEACDAPMPKKYNNKRRQMYCWVNKIDELGWKSLPTWWRSSKKKTNYEREKEEATKAEKCPRKAMHISQNIY